MPRSFDKPDPRQWLMAELSPRGRQVIGAPRFGVTTPEPVVPRSGATRDLDAARGVDLPIRWEPALGRS